MKKAIETSVRFLPIYLICIGYLLPKSTWAQMIFDKASVESGAVWRLLTAHWVHCDMEHFLFNTGSLALMILVFPDMTGKQLWGAIGMGIVAVDLWLLSGFGELNYYCGFSGVENAILIVGLYTFYRKSSKLLALLVGVGAALKIGFELNRNTAVFTHISWSPVPEAHAAGYLAGFLWVGMTILISHRVRFSSRLNCLFGT